MAATFVVFKTRNRVARLGGMAPIGLLLTAADALKFGFGALIAILFGLLFELSETALEWKVGN